MLIYHHHHRHPCKYVSTQCMNEMNDQIATMALPRLTFPSTAPVSRTRTHGPTFCARTSQESRKEQREKAQKVVDSGRGCLPAALLDAPKGGRNCSFFSWAVRLRQLLTNYDPPMDGIRREPAVKGIKQG